MKKLFLFVMVSLDGYFEGEDHDLSWHNVDAEFNKYAIKHTSEAGILLFGRKTYELMANYWPSAHAATDDPVVANLMNNTPKIVFSTTLKKAEWNNTRLVREINPDEIIRLKKESSKDLAMYGSNTLAVNMMKFKLIDEFRIMVNPVAIGKGTSLFKGLEEKVPMELIGTKKFKSGNVLLSYRPKL